MPGPVSTWMGDCLRTGKPSRYVTATELDSAFYPPSDGKKWVSAFGLDNNDKRRWWIRFTGCL